MTDIIMVRGQVSNRVGDALGQMLQNTKPVNTGTAPVAGGSTPPVPSPTPQQTLPHEPRSASLPQTRGSTAAGDNPPSSPAASSLTWDQEQIALEFHMREISEFEAIRALMDTGLGVCEAMQFLDGWE